jgi:hypothetical protein
MLRRALKGMLSVGRASYWLAPRNIRNLMQPRVPAEREIHRHVIYMSIEACTEATCTLC